MSYKYSSYNTWDSTYRTSHPTAQDYGQQVGTYDTLQADITRTQSSVSGSRSLHTRKTTGEDREETGPQFMKCFEVIDPEYEKVKKGIVQELDAFYKDRLKSALKDLFKQSKADEGDEEKIAELKDENENLKKQIEEEKSKRHHMERDFKKEKQERKQIEQELLQAKTSTEETVAKMEQKMTKNDDILKRHQQRYEQLEKALKETEKAKNDAMSRLSRQMGNQLSEGNPNIADLSDADRPTKLGENYNQLYDDKWTDSLETLIKTQKDEKDAIGMLYNILTDAYSFCEKKSQEQMALLERDLLHLSTTPVSTRDSKLSADVRRILKDARKTTSKNAYENLLMAFKRNLDADTHYAVKDVRNVQPYIEACFKLCYQMFLHDPPVALGTKPSRHDPFDESIYKEYTVSGTTVDFAVWPPLYLHKGGSLLSKGVVQPIRSEDRRKAHNQKRQFTYSKTENADRKRDDKYQTADRKYGDDGIANDSSDEYETFSSSPVSQAYQFKAFSHEKARPFQNRDYDQMNMDTKKVGAAEWMESRPDVRISDNELDTFHKIYELSGKYRCWEIYRDRYSQYVEAFNRRETERERKLLEDQRRAEATQAAQRRAAESLRWKYDDKTYYPHTYRRY